MYGYRFSDFIPQEQQDPQGNRFDQLLHIFNQLLTISSGDVTQAMAWLTQLDKQHQLTDEGYGIGDFFEDLKKKGYITEENAEGEIQLTSRGEQSIRRQSLEDIFGKLKKSPKPGNHRSPQAGTGDEITSDRRDYRFGDSLEQIAMTESIRNAQVNNGIQDFLLTENDLEVVETEYKAQTSTVRWTPPDTQRPMLAASRPSAAG